MRYNKLLLPVLVILTFPICAQQTTIVDNDLQNELEGKHYLKLGLGHAHIAEGEKDGEKSWITAPFWSLDYTYRISEKWRVGLQTDLISETFTIINSEDEEVERVFPVAITPVAVFKPFKRLSFIAGVGGEFTDGRTLYFSRLAFDYDYPINEKWEAGGTLLYDNKWKYYNSWGIAFTFTRILGK